MPRCGRIRTFIQNYNQSPRANKLSFFLPYLILILEIILLIDATIIDPNLFIALITLILVIISTIEIIIVTKQLRKKVIESNFDKILTIKLDDYITKKREKNLKKIISDFLNDHPEYYKHRNKIYHTTCQILETHEKEELEKDIIDKLKVFIKNNKKADVDQIVKKFMQKYPEYKQYPTEIYEKTCKLLKLRK